MTGPGSGAIVTAALVVVGDGAKAGARTGAATGNAAVRVGSAAGLGRRPDEGAGFDSEELPVAADAVTTPVPVADLSATG